MPEREDEPFLIKAVVFDFDGTLFEFLLDYAGMRNSVKEAVIARGVPASQLEGAERVKDIVEKMLNYANANKWSESKTNAIMNDVEVVMDRYEWECAQNNAPLDGVVKVLHNLKEMKLKTALLTNNSRRCIVYLLEKYNLSKMFDTVVTRNDLTSFNNLKPSPAGLNMVLGKLKVKPNQAIYIGDSVIDIRTALSVGATPIFVTTGFAKLSDVKAEFPNIVVLNHMGQLMTYIKENQ